MNNKIQSLHYKLVAHFTLKMLGCFNRWVKKCNQNLIDKLNQINMDKNKQPCIFCVRFPL